MAYREALYDSNVQSGIAFKCPYKNKFVCYPYFGKSTYLTDTEKVAVVKRLKFLTSTSIQTVCL